MTPKEKAFDLFKTYLSVLYKNITETGDGVDIERASKKCALIAVDEIIYSQNTRCMECGGGDIDYWKQVKQEIEKL